jgi:hypothetical protein
MCDQLTQGFGMQRLWFHNLLRQAHLQKRFMNPWTL